MQVAGDNKSNVVRHERYKSGMRDAFLGWQCRIRQIAVRRRGGRPSEGMMPLAVPRSASAPLGHIVVLLNKAPEYATVPEFRHMVRRTMDPAQRREAALRYLSEMYFQRPSEFISTLTATFAPESRGAAALLSAAACRLEFDQFNQRFWLECGVSALVPEDPLYAATYWHNSLFNPYLPGNAAVLAFEPDWASAEADPMPV